MIRSFYLFIFSLIRLLEAFRLVFVCLVFVSRECNKRSTSSSRRVVVLVVVVGLISNYRSIDRYRDLIDIEMPEKIELDTIRAELFMII